MSCKEKNWYVQENITAFSIKQLSKSRTRLDAQVAQVNKRGFLADKAKEHADLIAAAPELLNQLKILTDLVAGNGNDHVTRACNDALRIIKKIEGEL